MNAPQLREALAVQESLNHSLRKETACLRACRFIDQRLLQKLLAENRDLKRSLRC